MKSAKEYTEAAVRVWSDYITSGGSLAQSLSSIESMFREYGESVAVRQREECAGAVSDNLGHVPDYYLVLEKLRNGVRNAPLVTMP